jgi:hypothetical protein
MDVQDIWCDFVNWNQLIQDSVQRQFFLNRKLTFMYHERHKFLTRQTTLTSQEGFCS